MLVLVSFDNLLIVEFDLKYDMISRFDLESQFSRMIIPYCKLIKCVTIS